MALDTKNIADGAVTATQINAAYDPLNSKVDEFEFCVLDFLDGLMEVAGVQDTASFTRSKIVNVAEEIQTIVTAGESLSEEYKTEKILTLLGDGDRVDEVLAQMGVEEESLTDKNEPNQPEEDDSQPEEDEESQA